MPAGSDERGAGGEERRPILTHKTLTYHALSNLSYVLGKLFFRTRLEGAAHLPSEGGYLIVSNHQSFLDIPAIGGYVRGRHVSFVARESLARSRLLAFVMEQCGAVLVRRGTGDRSAVREMIEHLEEGDCLAVFPEGTRTSDGRMGPFRPGAALAARRAGVPLLPLAICGTFAAWPRQARFPRPARVTLRVGAPIESDLPDALDRARNAVLELIGEVPSGENVGSGPRARESAGPEEP